MNLDTFATHEAPHAVHVAPAKIDVLETSIRIHELHVENRDVAKYLDALPDDQREQAVVNAIKVGVKRGQESRDALKQVWDETVRIKEDNK